MNSSIRTIYVTESGCDLNVAFPDIAELDFRSRNGASWYDLMYRNPIQTKMTPYKVIVTTNAELEKIRAAEAAQRAAEVEQRAAEAEQRAAEEQQSIDNFVRDFIQSIHNLPASSRNMSELVDVIGRYVSKNCDTTIRMRVTNKICERILQENLLIPDQAAPPAETQATPSVDITEFPTISCNDYYEQYLSATQQTMQMIQTISAFSLIQTVYTPPVTTTPPLRKWIQGIAKTLDSSKLNIKTAPLLDSRLTKQVSHILV